MDWTRKVIRFSGLLLVAAIAVPALGCGSSESGPSLTPVAGTVTVNGSPVAGAGVSFRADKDNSTKHIPSGTADAQGRYELTTGGRKGAPAGWYKVVVTPAPPTKGGGGTPKASASPFNAKYSAQESTDVSIEVKAGATGSYDLKLSP